MKKEYVKLGALSWNYLIVFKCLRPCFSFDKFRKLTCNRIVLWLLGLGVCMSLWVREVPGSSPGRARCALHIFEGFLKCIGTFLEIP